MLDIDLFLRIVLIFASVFGIVGISWQLMRFLSKTTETLEEFRQTNKKANTIADRISNDYDYISSSVKALSTTIERVNTEILNPILSIARIFKAAQHALQGALLRIKDEPEADDYLPEE